MDSIPHIKFLELMTTVHSSPPPFSEELLQWYDLNGRQQLPWQTEKTPYRIWVSEVMLQQTQVKTVLPYFKSFITRFPSIEALSEASEDAVLGAWSGLGYYRRARALHKAAKLMVEAHQSAIPSDLHLLLQLPGIGRSTAHAILSFAFQANLPILDGNVKRVLKRYYFPTMPSISEAILWQKAFEALPQKRSDAYNQALMDVGALICKPRQPECAQCPLSRGCQALAQCAQGLPELTSKKRLRVKPEQPVWMTWLWNEHGEVWLERVPQNFRVWQGLWSPPVWLNQESWEQAAAPLEAMKMKAKLWIAFPKVKQACTHLDLIIYPYSTPQGALVLERLGRLGGQWVHPERWNHLGLPSFVKRYELYFASKCSLLPS